MHPVHNFKSIISFGMENRFSLCYAPPAYIEIQKTYRVKCESNGKNSIKIIYEKRIHRNQNHLTTMLYIRYTYMLSSKAFIIPLWLNMQRFG